MAPVIIGYGEVGKALHKIIVDAIVFDVTFDKDTLEGIDHFDVVHICIPYSDKFEEIVKYYKDNSSLVIVHSSVPVGTCDRLGVVHSPIRGVHPRLDKGIRTFVKYFGGKGAKVAANIFDKLEIKTKVFDEARTTEAIKLWDTTQYGKLIMLEKEIYEWCQKNRVDFDAVYTQANRDYDVGYIKLGMPHVVRPYLKHVPGPIGGHCVVPNAKLLGVEL